MTLPIIQFPRPFAQRLSSGELVEPASRSKNGKAERGRRSRRSAERPVSSACNKVVEALEQRQLLSADGWEVSYWGNNTYAGTDGTQPAYVLQDNASQSGGTVKDFSGNTVNDAINYAGSATVLPPQLAAIGVSSTWTDGTAGTSYSARFDGILTAPETAIYTFYPGSDDGDELIVDGQILDNSLGDTRGVTYDTAPVLVQWPAGSTHQISYLYQNGGGGWGQDLRWSDNVSIGVGLAGSNAPYVPISAITMPSGPINASVTAGAGGDTIKWGGFNASSGGTAATDAGDNLAYDVYRAPVTVGGTLPAFSAFAKIASAVAGNTYTDTTAVAGTAYDYRVTSAGIALGPSADILNTGKGLASAVNGTSANSTGTNDTLIGAGDGLTAQYFNNDITAGSTADNLTQDHAATYSRIDTQINVNGTSYPSPPGIPSNGFNAELFSIRWDGYVLAPETGTYVFYPTTDDDERFSVGIPTALSGAQSGLNDYGTSAVSTPGNGTNETIIAEGTGSGSNTTGAGLDFVKDAGRGVTYDRSAAVYAYAGQLIPIQFDYNQRVDGYHYSLNWAGPGFGSTPVSENYTNSYTLLTAPDLYAADAEAPTIAAVGGYASAIVTLSLPLSRYTNGGTAADSFSIYRSTVAGELGAIAASVTIPNSSANSATTTYTYTDTGLSNGTTYYYTAAAVASGVESAASAQVSAAAQAIPPAAPTGVVVAGNNSMAHGVQVQVFFPAVDFADSYIVQRASESSPGSGTPGTFATVPGGDDVKGAGTTIRFTDSDPALQANLNYFYRVIATGSGLQSAPSTAVKLNAVGPALATEGTVEVDVRASSYPTSATSSIVNFGNQGGVFTANGGAISVGAVADASSIAYQAFQFNGGNAASSSFNSASDLNGNSPRSIEVWVDNPAINTIEETMVSWSHRGGNPDGSNMSLSDGSQYGAGLWGSEYDLQWTNTAPGVTGTGAPAAGIWNYVVFIYDGTNDDIYVDGHLYLQRTVAGAGLDTFAGFPINLAAQNAATIDGDFTAASLGSLDLASVRIESGALTPADVMNNYLVGIPGQYIGPEVIAISPPTGPVAGGSTVVITGANFTGATAVTFGVNPAINFTIYSPTQITAVDPAGTAGVVDVRITAESGGVSATSTSDQFTYVSTVTAPTLVGSPVINGDNPNGLFSATGQPTLGVQRSMVEDLVYTFSEPVTIPNADASFTVVGAGANPGAAPASLSATVVPGSDSTQWAVTLTGAAPGALGSIANGEYSITINPAGVFAAADGVTQLAAARTDQFYRLFGDINGDEVINASDNLQLKRALTTYNPAFDSNADGIVNAADNLAFKKDLTVAYFGDGFVPTI